YEGFDASGAKLLPERTLHDGAPHGVANPVADRVGYPLLEPLRDAALDGISKAIADQFSDPLGIEPPVGALHDRVSQFLAKTLAHRLADSFACHLFQTITRRVGHSLPYRFRDPFAHRVGHALADVAEGLAAHWLLTRNRGDRCLHCLIETPVF